MLPMIDVLCALLLITLLSSPDLPLSKAVVERSSRFLNKHATFGRAALAIAFAVLVFGALWALQGDAPMVLAMALPELAAWFAAFEVSTLIDALVGVGFAALALRSAGLMNYLRGRTRARRTRKAHRTERKCSDSDEPERWALAA